MGRHLYLFSHLKRASYSSQSFILTNYREKRLTQVEMSLCCHRWSMQLWGYHLSFVNLYLPHPLFPRWSLRRPRPHADQGSCTAPLWCHGHGRLDTECVVSWEVLLFVGHQCTCSFSEWLSLSSFLQWRWISLASDDKQHSEERQKPKEREEVSNHGRRSQWVTRGMWNLDAIWKAEHETMYEKSTLSTKGHSVSVSVLLILMQFLVRRGSARVS